MLLPDGRVWSAGDDYHPLLPNGSPSSTDTGEIYSPPYLFRGPRPTIATAPKSLGYGGSAVVQTGAERRRTPPS